MWLWVWCEVGRLFLLLALLDFSLATLTRRGIANGIGSSSNRPIVKTDIIMGNGGAVKAVASFSKGFVLSIPTGDILIVSCVNCIARRIPATKGGSLRVILGRSAGALSRIIIVNCNARHGNSIADSMTDIGTSGFMGKTIGSIKRLVRKGMTNLTVAGPGNSPAKDARVHLHNAGAVNKTGATPLMLVSKVPKRLNAITPRSIRDISILGSNSTTTVCNAHNAGNIVLVAAGRTGKISVGRIRCGNCIDASLVTGGLSVLGTSRFHALCPSRSRKTSAS